jgi:hypothetical protein
MNNIWFTIYLSMRTQKKEIFTPQQQQQLRSKMDAKKIINGFPVAKERENYL